jgi:hypothetical protein
MAVQIVEEALRGNISGGDGSSAVQGRHRKERQLWHANMPNIRIAFMISQFRYGLNAEILNTG